MSKLDKIELVKLYYSIGEVAEIFEVNTSLIRFWEKEFAIIKPKKNKNGARLFTIKDIQNFNKIYELVKEKGFTLDGAKKAIKAKNTENENTVESTEDSIQIIQKLEEIKSKLLALKKS
ncbi:MAG: MerR family transcriptional regulator [Fluviicola sp.]